jgi:hypothetical protein
VLAAGFLPAGPFIVDAKVLRNEPGATDEQRK